MTEQSKLVVGNVTFAEPLKEKDIIAVSVAEAQVVPRQELENRFYKEPDPKSKALLEDLKISEHLTAYQQGAVDMVIQQNRLKETQEVTTPVPIASEKAPSLLAVIERAALNPLVDVDKMMKLLEMQERIIERQAKAEFSAAFVQMQPELPKVIRTKRNEQTKSNYAALEDVNETVAPTLHKYGFGIQHKILGSDDKGVTVKVELWHSAGHVESTTMWMPIDDKGIAGTKNKTLPHAVSSSAMYARRVATCALLNISTGDDKDGNGAAKGKEKDPFTNRVNKGELTIEQRATNLKAALHRKKTVVERSKLLANNLTLLKELDAASHHTTVAEIHTIVREGIADEASA